MCQACSLFPCLDCSVFSFLHLIRWAHRLISKWGHSSAAGVTAESAAQESEQTAPVHHLWCFQQHLLLFPKQLRGRMGFYNSSSWCFHSYTSPSLLRLQEVEILLFFKSTALVTPWRGERLIKSLAMPHMIIS